MVKIGKKKFKVAEDGTIRLNPSQLDEVWPYLPDRLCDDRGHSISIRAAGYVFTDAGRLRERMHKAHLEDQWRIAQDVLVPEPFDPARGWLTHDTTRRYGTNRLTNEPLLCFPGYRAEPSRQEPGDKVRWNFVLYWFLTSHEALRSSAHALETYVNQLDHLSAASRSSKL